MEYNGDKFRDIEVEDYSDTYSPSADDSFPAGRSVEHVPQSVHIADNPRILNVFREAEPAQADASTRVDLARSDLAGIKRHIVFVDQQSRDVIKSIGNPALKQVNVIDKSTRIDAMSDDVQFIVSQNTLEIELPKISTDTSRAIGSTRFANSMRMTAVLPTVSHVLTASKGDKFVTGSATRRLRGGESKTLYGINGVWYDA